MKSLFGLELLALSAAMLAAQASPKARTIPQPFPDHPGNIFVEGESVRLAAPSGVSESWRAVDYEGRTVAEGSVLQSTIDFGQLPAGYYEVLRGAGQGTNRVSVAVVRILDFS
jgi:hypothetical protein